MLEVVAHSVSLKFIYVFIIYSDIMYAKNIYAPIGRFHLTRRESGMASEALGIGRVSATYNHTGSSTAGRGGGLKNNVLGDL
jgi:hypothetical protein